VLVNSTGSTSRGKTAKYSDSACSMVMRSSGVSLRASLKDFTKGGSDRPTFRLSISSRYEGALNLAAERTGRACRCYHRVSVPLALHPVVCPAASSAAIRGIIENALTTLTVAALVYILQVPVTRTQVQLGGSLLVELAAHREDVTLSCGRSVRSSGWNPGARFAGLAHVSRGDDVFGRDLRRLARPRAA